MISFERARLHSWLKNSDFILGLKGRGFSRAAKSFVIVVPSCPQPRLRGEDSEDSAFSSKLFSRAVQGAGGLQLWPLRERSRRLPEPWDFCYEQLPGTKAIIPHAQSTRDLRLLLRYNFDVHGFTMPETLPFIPNQFFRCAGPNCGVLKGVSDRWWVMWTSFDEGKIPVVHLAPWDEELVVREGAMPVCGERCAQKLQSQFMGNVLENRMRRSGGG